MFFSFDGVDGAGKSTQMELFIDWLGEQGVDVISCRDPGGTQLGEMLRSILLDSKDMAINRRSEMLLYMAARAQLVDEVIRPALAAGRVVICDRFLLANVVYQGWAGGLAVEQVRQVGLAATDGVMPDITFLLDLDVDEALRRIGPERDRMESQGAEYLRQVRQGFLAEAKEGLQQVAVIDAAQSVEAVQAEIRAAAAPLLAMAR